MRRAFAPAIFAGCLAFGISSAAFAQMIWPTPNGHDTVGSFVQLCINLSGQAVPIYNAAGTYQCSGSSGQGTTTAATTTTVNSTVSVTNTFQAALAASATRKGCLLQNTGAHVQYIYFGTLGSATTSNSFQINAGQTISCNAGPVVLTDAVGITGTAGDGYIVTSQ
jgi:hypothetical protein